VVSNMAVIFHFMAIEIVDLPIKKGKYIMG
jgi:hypothetical protein